jgi:hypothetical protein
VHARALADKTLLDAWDIMPDRLDQAEQALTIAREVGDPALTARALAACGSIAAYDADAAAPYFAEASDLARELGDQWRFCRSWGAVGGQLMTGGDLRTALHLASHGPDAPDARLHEAGNQVAGTTGPGSGAPRSGRAVAALGPACAVLQPQ